jgi:hypothetical protein
LFGFERNKHSIGAHYMNLQFKIGVWAVWAVLIFMSEAGRKVNN